jgi:hypothetical protein
MWESSIRDLRVWMLAEFTDPLIVEAFCSGLLSWQSQGIRLTNEIGYCQDILGWQQLFEGYMSKLWLETQSSTFQSTKIKRNLLQWLSAIIKKLWQIALNMWDLRNSAEHEHDNDELSKRLNTEITGLIALHPNQSDGPLHPSEIYKLRSAQIFYKLAWILNIRAADQRNIRKDQNDTYMNGMRNIMRNFLNV